MIELLSPVGDFDCLKAAVQNGADAVYFGSNSFSARAFASNFDDNSLEKAINYAKIRGVKTNLTLNTLIKNNEINEAISLASKAYQYGIDAIIVQDLGLAKYLIDNFPDLDIHASTQMSIHNLDGVKQLEKLGFSRAVLSRELSLNEIEYICKNSNIEIEVFVHGALCISYSGQCLFSSIVGDRSGNRGKCAQPCRLPYELIENTSIIDKGFLLSPKDLCGLEFLPKLINSGVSCLKIEGRMKTPEYVATVTRIYRKYIDLISNGKNFVIDEKDKNDLLQVFNRGGFSSGHLKSEPNKDLIYKQKSNNMGVYLGKVSKFNNSKGYITLTSKTNLSIGDKISIENNKYETSLYTVSELMINNKNTKQSTIGDTIKIGRMKGNINIGDKIYKISDKVLYTTALSTLTKENRKTDLMCKLIVKRNTPISLEIFTPDSITISLSSDIIPVEAINSPITKERLISQLSKTTNTPFKFSNIEVILENGLFIPNISIINELRRQAIYKYEEKMIENFKRQLPKQQNYYFNNNDQKDKILNKSVSLLLNTLNLDYDYLKLKNVNNIYIPFKYFVNNVYINIIHSISQKFNVYIYIPNIIRNNYNNIIKNNIKSILNRFKITGFVVSNLGNFELLKEFIYEYDFICNYTFNIYNNLSISALSPHTITLSPELNFFDIKNLNTTSKCELIVYGRTPLMNINYCLLGNSNKCYTECSKRCISNNKYFIKDRLGLLFRIIPANIQTITTIYNSKITFINSKDIPITSLRIDIIDETIDEINNIINISLSGNKLEGKDYTNGNFNKNI